MTSTATPNEDIAERKKTAKKVATRLAGGVGGMIDELARLRKERMALEEQVKASMEEYRTVEEMLTEALHKQGLEGASGKTATASFGTPQVCANVEDWDKFLEFIYDNKFGHLFQRRVSDPAYRELRAMGTEVPGATDFVKQRLNLRSI